MESRIVKNGELDGFVRNLVADGATDISVTPIQGTSDSLVSWNWSPNSKAAREAIEDSTIENRIVPHDDVGGFIRNLVADGATDISVCPLPGTDESLVRWRFAAAAAAAPESTATGRVARKGAAKPKSPRGKK